MPGSDPLELLQPGDARFDAARGAWILTSYADVSAALRDPRLPAPATAMDAAAHISMRAAAARAFSPERLAAWRAEIEPLTYKVARSLPADRTVDLVQDFAAPVSLALALLATGAPKGDTAQLTALAREIFLAGACASDARLQPRALSAAAELARLLPIAGAPVAVQAFVALSQTLPYFLANAWLELLRHPRETIRLRAQPGLMPQAVEELLRYAGPSRAIFRQAVAPVPIGCASIAQGDPTILMLSAANRDPAQFPDAGRLDFRRGAPGHLAFGGGLHSCFGAPLIRMAAAVATRALLDTTDAVESSGPVEWIGGFAIRAPRSLPAVLRR